MKVKSVESGAQPIKRKSMTAEAMSRLLRNKMAMTGLAIVLVIAFLCIFANVIAPYDYDEQNVDAIFQKPCAEFLLGTDYLGRDLFSRLLYGGRISLLVGFVSTGIAAVFGITLGAFAGYFGGVTDSVIMRTMDAFSAVPSTLLAIVISAILGSGMINCMIAVGISFIPMFARITRAPILAVKEMEYVEAARAIDASTPRILIKHVIPNISSPLIIQITSSIATGLMVSSGLSYLGLGAQPPQPEWGQILSDGSAEILRYPYLTIFPAILIGLVVLSMNMFGDGLRDALDPKLKD